MKKERVLLVVVDYLMQPGWAASDIGEEMTELVKACGGDVLQIVYSRLAHPSPATLIGEGKLKEIADICSMLQADTVVFSYELKGSQQRNIEEVVQIKTIDRTQLILDIFARHAASLTGKKQVELAQLEYLLPRLVGKGIALSRLGGGIGTLGPGETKLEVDRRRISQRIDRLKKDLQDITGSRRLRRQRRKDRAVPVLSLVGYTNAGKSTLLNALTQAEQTVRNGLFTTLDSLSRQMVLSNHQKVVVSDTVGFMHNLPHHLIESFKATLEEVQEADILLHVLDVSHSRFRNLHDAVRQVLRELDADDKPTVLVLNKIDLLTDMSVLERMAALFPNTVALSARTGQGVADLQNRVEGMLAQLMTEIDLLLPIQRMDLVSLAHRDGQVMSVKYYNDRIHLRATVPVSLAGKLSAAIYRKK